MLTSLKFIFHLNHRKKIIIKQSDQPHPVVIGYGMQHKLTNLT